MSNRSLLETEDPQRRAPLRLVDCEHAAAYRSLAATISIEPEAPGDADLRKLVHAYAHALDRSRQQHDHVVWAAFVRRAPVLYEALERQTEHNADPTWRRAAKTLEQIVSENADLIPST